MTVGGQYDAATVIHQTCSDLVESYVALAEHGKNVLGNIHSVIGRIKQYKYDITYSAGFQLTTVTEYRDDPYAWWEKGLIYMGQATIHEEIVDHPRQQEARDALASAQGIVDDVDEKFELDSRDMRDTVLSVANHMKSWVDASAKTASLGFPSSTSQVPTSGDVEGWRSPSAKAIYDDNVYLQHGAHETTSTSIESMLSKDAAFLEKMADHLAAFANQERDQWQYYTDLATESWIPDEWSIDAIIETVGQIGDKVLEFKQLQIDELQRVNDVLNSAVTDVLAIQEQKNTISRLKEPASQGEDGWPSPANVAGRTTAGDSDFETLKFNTQYFKDHVTFWADLSSDFDGPIADASGAPAIAPMFLRFPAFSSTTSSALNDLAEHILDKALKRGQTAAKELSETLDAMIRTYVAGEDLNAAEAAQLQRMLDE